MKKNLLFEISQTISSSLDDKDILQQLLDSLQNFNYVYSYIVQANYRDDCILSWTIRYKINEVNKYNTLCRDNIVYEIYNLLLSHKQTTTKIIGYKQPSFEIMFELYTPLIQSLAKQTSERWNTIEYDDALVMCQMTMFELYKKGYYLHKYLLKKAFENRVLMSLRKEKNAPELVSLDEIMHDSDSDNQLTLADMLQDNKTELQHEEQERLEQVDQTFNVVKKLLIDMIGERQFEQLYRDYANKHTTAWSRKTMQTIKRKLQKANIDKNLFGEF